MNPIARALHRRKCPHHDHFAGVSWIVGATLHTTRTRKNRRYRCAVCNRRWRHLPR